MDKVWLDESFVSKVIGPLLRQVDHSDGSPVCCDYQVFYLVFWCRYDANIIHAECRCQVLSFVKLFISIEYRVFYKLICFAIKDCK